MSAAPHTVELGAEDTLWETDEPPENAPQKVVRSPSGSTYTKSAPPPFSRRESLLTRQLHGSEGESHTEDETRGTQRSLRRGVSASSNPSVTSAAELTSDNDLTSPGTRNSSASPPFLAIRPHFNLPLMEKPILEEPSIVRLDEDPDRPAPVLEDKVEAGLGRRRCIKFACGDKAATPKPEQRPQLHTSPTPQGPPAEAPKRKSALTFVCPSKASAQVSPERQRLRSHRQQSPLPRSPRSPRAAINHAHRGSDSTVKNVSPSSLRKVPSLIKRRKYSEDNEGGQNDAARFHEFAASEAADDDWVRESGCHQRRLTVKDTLHKENVFRRIGEEAEEEALSEEDHEDEEELLDDLEDAEDDEEENDNEAVDQDEHDNDNEDEDDNNGDERVDVSVDINLISDAGFDTDDEEGFAGSDAESTGSDFEWWAPGRSTAATSTDQLDHIRPSRRRTLSDSSLESSREANGLSQKPQPKMKRKTHAVKINRPVTPDLPDSTDFVCGTLDEDRPIEQAYISCMEQKKAAKHKVTPQDIDPSFPASDPEMDEEDEDEDDGDQKHDTEDGDTRPMFVHDNMDSNESRRGRTRASSGSTKKTSPHHSPRRLHSPPPPPSRKVVHRSPPAPVRKQSHRSPPAPTQRPTRLRSPPPPKRLFGQSPKRLRSPAPGQGLTSPPNSRRPSADSTPSQAIGIRPGVLGSRPQPTQTASLPRVPTAIRLHHLGTEEDEDDHNGGEHQGSFDLHPRGAIDIVKGLEKKRQRRREKLYQKHCQKKIKEGEKKPKPGKGVQRMREVGLELAAYRGKKAEHMLSY